MAFTDSEAQRFQTEIQNFIETIRPPELMRENRSSLSHQRSVNRNSVFPRSMAVRFNAKDRNPTG